MPPRKKPEATGIEALLNKSVKLIDRYGNFVPHEGTLKAIQSGWLTIETKTGRTTCINIEFLSGIAEVRETETN